MKLIGRGVSVRPDIVQELCRRCGMCQRSCPAEAIEITALSDVEKKFRMVIHNDRCIHCAQCVDSCPTTPKAMEMDNRFEIADFDRHNLKMEWDFVRAVPKREPKPPVPGAPPAGAPAKTESAS
jgi:formate hydrogenlyase subunit 6/NADH:ubiquinone oxidoreductase subunit I